MTVGSAETSEIVVVLSGSTELEQVIALSKRYQATLGQLPFEAFRKFASERRILAVIDDGAVVAYALYRVRRKSCAVVLVHLCVDSRHRGRGRPERLIEAICDLHPLSPGVAVWCREDYPAHRRWPSLGFDRTGDRPGRGREARTLVHWWRPINDLSLFTYLPDDELLPAAAVDSNVFRDVYEPRPQHGESLALVEPWMLESVELVTTPHLITEIEQAGRTIATLRGSGTRLRALSPPPTEWGPMLSDLKVAMSDTAIEEADLRQIAQASAGGARYFVTRDGCVLANSRDIETIAGIRVLAPLDLMLAVHSDQFEMNYEASALRESDLQVVHPHALPTTTELVSFTDHATGERSTELASELRMIAPALTAGARLWALAAPDAPPVVLAATSLDGQSLLVHTLRVRSGGHQVTFARQMLQLLREEAVARECERVELAGSVPTYVRSALLAEGFTSASGHWRAFCGVGTIGPDEYVPHTSPPLRARSLEPEQVSQHERALWPLKIVTGKVPTYIVPIRPAWARALFGDDPQAELFARPRALTVAREHVYYRSLSRSIESPARLLWWASGGGNNGGMRATSWLEAKVIGRPRTLHRQFGSQGIYERHNVESIVTRPGGQALALVFSRTETFSSPIGLSRARQILPSMAQNGYLQSMRRIDEHAFVKFYEIGTAPR